MKKLIPIFITLLICSACNEDFFETTLKVDPPPHEDQMVLHTFAKSEDSLLFVSLTQSTGILENNNNYFDALYINDATIEIFEDGALKYALEPSGDDYFNYSVALDADFATAGKTYEIKATHNTLPTITASQTMPSNPMVVSAVFDEGGGLGIDDAEPTNAIDITINDPAGENFYELIFVKDGTASGGNIRSYYMETLDVNASEGLDRTILVDGSSFDGDEYTLQVETGRDWENTLFIFVRSISRDWYLYSKSMNAFRNGPDFELFVEPITIHTNIDNGLGVFALGAEVRVPVEEE